MRLVPVLALLLLAPLASAAEPSPCGEAEAECGSGRHREAERRSPSGSAWVEVLPDWRGGPATVAFGNATLDVPARARFATDGATWLYVVNATGGLQPPPWGCMDPEGNATTGAWVLLLPAQCAWVRHPGVACWAFAPCHEAGGRNHEPSPAAPPPTTTTWFRPTPASHLTDTCGRVQGLRCTPTWAWAPLAALGAAFLMFPSRKYGE